MCSTFIFYSITTTSDSSYSGEHFDNFLRNNWPKSVALLFLPSLFIFNGLQKGIQNFRYNQLVLHQILLHFCTNFRCVEVGFVGPWTKLPQTSNAIIFVTHSSCFLILYRPIYDTTTFLLSDLHNFMNQSHALSPISTTIELTISSYSLFTVPQDSLPLLYIGLRSSTGLVARLLGSTSDHAALALSMI